MKLGDGVEWALHCATVLALVPADMAMPAANLAEFHGVPPAYLAKTLQALARAGIVESVPGRRGGYRLGRRAADVTMLDVVEAVEGREPSFRCTEIRRRGPARVRTGLYPSVCAIADVMYRADEAWREELRKTTLADLLARLARTIPAEATVKATSWMRGAMR
jgi:Rrf2 family protein